MRFRNIRFPSTYLAERSFRHSMTVVDAVAPHARKDVWSATSLADKLLSDDQFHIEFQGYLTNHSKHAIVALHGLQAPKDVISRYWDAYTREVPYGWTLEPSHTQADTDTLTSEASTALLGKKQQFPELVAFFEEEMDKLGTEELLKKYVPQLIPGAAAAVTHAIIHLGWALDFGNRYMTIEGLAYMAYTFLSVHPERFESSSLPEQHPVDSLIQAASDFVTLKVPNDIRAIKEAPQYSLESGWHPELHAAGFQWHLSKVLDNGHDIFLKLPEWLDAMPTSEALEGMYRAVTLLYLVSAGEPSEQGNGDFVVLHLITSLWGAEQAIQNLPEEFHATALKCYWASAIAIVATTQRGFPPEAMLRRTCEKFEAAFDPELMDDGTVEYESGGGLSGEGKALEVLPDGTQAWAQIVQRAYEEEEEHNIKLVYVCRELWKRYGKWQGFRVAASRFTLTPNIGPNAPEFSA